MEAVLLVGIQGAGKSTFYQQRFFDTHVRINLDMLKTRYRAEILLHACILAKQPFVVDNTNVLASERAKYIAPAREAGFRVVGYFFPVPVRHAIGRNQKREGKKKIPVQGILGTHKRLQPPSREEGFDRLYCVTVTEANEFVVEECPEEA
ncbi:MAG TPA: AAA family ATPase [Thermoanaerobaculia bacterium]|jgi:predicted kinase